MITDLSQLQSTGGAESPAIFDADVTNFEDAVLKASYETPVIADFWAPWCEPCKQLMPVLEQEVTAANGAVKLAKINIDENPELAQALRVQSVPAVFAFFQGKPVSGFQGVRPQGEIKSLIQQLVQLAKQGQPDALNIPELLSEAARAIANGNLEAAQQAYMSILEQDETNAQAYTGLVRTFIAADMLDTARGMVDNAQDNIKKEAVFSEAVTALELAEAKPTVDAAKLEKDIEKNPDNHEARFDLANGLFAAGQKEEAMDHLIEIIRRNKAWEEEKARTQLLKFFDAVGPADPLTIAARRKLSSVLFS